MKKRIKPRNKVGKITIKGGNKLLIINFTFCGLSFLRCVRKGRKLRIFVNFIKSHEDYMNFVDVSMKDQKEARKKLYKDIILTRDSKNFQINP